MRSFCCCLVLASTAAVPACGSASDAEISDDLAAYQSEVIRPNGSRVNGSRVNGSRVNGSRVNGTELTATIALSGSELVLSNTGSLLAAATSLVGAVIPTDLASGEVIDLTIRSISYDSSAAAYLYDVTYPNPKNGKPEPLCGQAQGRPILALALAGRYDDDTGVSIRDNDHFTFACVDAAIGKCALWGYHPAKTRSECLGSQCKMQPLAPWHQACIRMVRADYCGDGVPHTRDGTAINIWDNLGIERPDPSSWGMEAEWTANGARCIRHARWVQADKSAGLTDMAYIQSSCPNRLAVNQPSACVPETSDFFPAYGFNLAPVSRRLLRNQSEGNLTNKGDAKK